MILLQTINESALQMNRLFKNLLDMARLESGKLQLKWEWVDIQEVIGVALRSVHNIREHDLIINIAENLPLVKADFILIEQVLINLLNNAMKYSSSGSKIFIDVKKGEKEIELIVSDNGPQIPVEDRERIFNKFYRSYTQKETSGTGLGLSICKGIIEAHGGSIRLDSNSQDGNDFIFTIPI
jgi:two-component system sensor histidine kinase KdpD